MLRNLMTKPVELNIDDKIITFKSIEEFEFALGARSTIPLDKIIEAIKATPNELDMEANAIVVAKEQISELLNTSSEQGEVTQNLKAINPVIFSNDNGWRDIFFALKKDQSTESSQYKQVALTAYLEYLSNRQEMIKFIKVKQKNDNNKNSNVIEFKTGALEIEEKFDSKILAEKLGMTSLPKAEAVRIDVEEGDEILLLLADYKCKLVIKDGVTFIDNNDFEYYLETGESKIGRGSECQVRFMDAMQRISRLHMLILNHDDKQLELTDLSSYGTYYLKKSS